MNATLEAFPLVLKRNLYDAVIFDLDGVVTRTAEVHAQAWKQMFDLYCDERRELSDFAPFDIEADYPEHLDGKPRYDGVQSFLQSRKLDSPM